MANYSFTSRLTGELATLSEIDAIICETFKIPVNPDHFSMEFNTLVEVGFAAAWHTGKTDEIIWNHFLDKQPKFAEHLKATPIFESLLRRLLVDEYCFQAWR